MRQAVRPLIVASTLAVTAVSGCTPAVEDTAASDGR